MKKKLKKIICLLLCCLVVLPSNFVFADTMRSESLPTKIEEDSNKNKEPKEDTQKPKGIEENKDDESTFTLSVSGNGNAIVKLAKDTDENLKDVQAGKSTTIDVQLGEEVYVKSYAVDGNETTFNESGCEVVSEKKGKLTTTRIYKINSSKATLEISFTGGEKENK